MDSPSNKAVRFAGEAVSNTPKVPSALSAPCSSSGVLCRVDGRGECPSGTPYEACVAGDCEEDSCPALSGLLQGTAIFHKPHMHQRFHLLMCQPTEAYLTKTTFS